MNDGDPQVLELEDELVGMEVHEVPTAPPTDECNGKKTAETEDPDRGYIDVFDGYCNNKAGKGTDHVGEGRCKFHGGATETPGAPKHNQNATKHAASADPHHYAQSLPQDRRQFVEDLEATICDRIRQKGRKPDLLDRVLARRTAIKLDMVAKMSDHVENASGLLQTIQHEHGSHEDKAPLIDEIRRYDDSLFGNLKQLGVLDDPESQKAEALDQWKQFIEQGAQSQSTH